MSSWSGSQLWNRFKHQDILMRILLTNIIVFAIIGLTEVLYKLIFGLNVSSTLGEQIVRYLILPADITKFVLSPWTLFTYMFWHIGLGHIVMNMLMFYIFGSIFQEYLGGKRLLQVYLWGGISGGALFLLLINLMPGLQILSTNASLAGASAAVMAVLVGAATLLPRYEMSVFGIFYIRLPYIAGFFALLSLLSMAGTNAGGEIAHVGGALFGFYYIKAIYSHFGWIEKMRKKIKSVPEKKASPKPDMKVYEPSKTYIKPSANRRPSQEEVDIILDKIIASGYESLSQVEKDILFKASEK